MIAISVVVGDAPHTKIYFCDKSKILQHHSYLGAGVSIMTKRRRRTNDLAIGTINCRGIRGELKQKQLVGDITRYKVQILALQETHLQGTGTFEVSDGNNTYEIFYTGADDNRYHGVGIAADKNLKGQYKRISDRICTMTTHVNKKKISLHMNQHQQPAKRIQE